LYVFLPQTTASSKKTPTKKPALVEQTVKDVRSLLKAAAEFGRYHTAVPMYEYMSGEKDRCFFFSVGRSLLGAPKITPIKALYKYGSQVVLEFVAELEKRGDFSQPADREAVAMLQSCSFPMLEIDGILDTTSVSHPDPAKTFAALAPLIRNYFKSPNFVDCELGGDVEARMINLMSNRAIKIVTYGLDAQDKLSVVTSYNSGAGEHPLQPGFGVWSNFPMGVIEISLHTCNAYEYGYKDQLGASGLLKQAKKLEAEAKKAGDPPGSTHGINHFNLIPYAINGKRTPTPYLPAAHLETEPQKQARHASIHKILLHSRKNIWPPKETTAKK
jgi:hypothetical protein